MYIKRLQLENFRCFEQLTIDFPKDYTVLMGGNGAGKSSILDAVAIAMSSFLAGCGIQAANFHKTDVRFLTYTYEKGGFNREAQYPVRISAQAETENQECIAWTRALNSERGRTTVGEARPIMNHADALCQRVKKNLPVTLPFLAYYGTGRLWLPKRTKKDAVMRGVPSRLHGYVDALDAATNEKLMLQWFQRTALMEVQKGISLPIFQAVKRTMEKLYAEMDDTAEAVQVFYDFNEWEIEIRVTDKAGANVSLPLRYFSDGIKAMLSMTADIAYRMVTLNPQLGGEAIAETPGIVLIDEIDMHLHPSWQRKILTALRKSFPKIQFIVTTHAPAVLANAENEHIMIFSHGKVVSSEKYTYGRDVTAILRDVMHTEVRPKEVVEKKALFYEVLEKGEFSRAEELLADLEKVLGAQDEDILRMQVMLDMERL